MLMQMAGHRIEGNHDLESNPLGTKKYRRWRNQRLHHQQPGGLSRRIRASSWTGQSTLQSEPARMPLRGGPQTMANLSSIITQLRKERDRVERQLTGLNAALTAFANVYSGSAINGKRQISAAGRKRIAAAQRARWAKVRRKAKVAIPKRTMSAASRRKIAVAQRARWAKVRKAKA
jgi:hypothetical protein